MTQEIRIKKRSPYKGDDGHKVVSVRMRDETLERLGSLSEKTNRSRNELINFLIERALEMVKIEE